MEVDFGCTAEDYATHRAGFPDELFRRLAAVGIGLSGQDLLDLGSGTGSLARGFAAAGARVVALDPSAETLAQARRLAEADGLDITFQQATAEETGLPSAAFDVVSAGQCWHWFDRAAAGREVRRLLKPGGRLVIAHFDWLPLAGTVVAASEALIREHNPDWRFHGGNGLHPRWFDDVAGAGFTGIESFTFDQDVRYSRAAWRGRIRASAGVGGSLQADAVAAFDRAHAAMLAAGFPADPLAVPHRAFALIAVSP